MRLPYFTGWEQILNGDQAKRKRKCHRCNLDILAGEEHLSCNVDDGCGEQHRFNTCLVCAGKVIKSQTTYLNNLSEVVKEYLIDHPEIKGRRMLQTLKVQK